MVDASAPHALRVPNDPSFPPEPAPRTGHGLFRPRATTLFRVGLMSVVLLMAATGASVFAYFHSPYWNRIGLAPDQPVLFSHRHHAGELRIDCRFCHATVETSAFAGMPATGVCLNCHSQIFTDTAMLQPVIHSASADEPLRWTRVTRLPDHVFFNHGIHVSKGVGCVVCHGELGRMALTAKAEPLDMRWCIECHREPGSRLQSQGRLFAALKPPAPESTALEALALAYAVHPDHLTNCSTCHH